ncbi:MAG: inosine/xanthosine triphosphatase [Candidatus Hodarchaeota archaeon]
MQIVVGTQNPVKLTATKQAFTKYYRDVEIHPVSVTSGVNPFPMTQQETLIGALNRAQAASKAFPTAKFAVGIESGVYTLSECILVQAFAAVKQNAIIGVGASVGFEVSKDLIALLDPTSDLSKSTINSLLGRKHLFENEGLVGVLTQNRLNRTEILRDAVICALPRFLTPQHFSQSHL